jgi:hypothetical protein
LPNRPSNTAANDLQEVATRHQIAQDLTEGLAAEHPEDIWQHVLTAFADIPALTAEITRLRADLADTRLDRANLAAAALAAITAHDEGEPDPLCYLRDELRAQGHDTTGRGSR